VVPEQHLDIQINCLDPINAKNFAYRLFRPSGFLLRVWWGLIENKDNE
jgi:hypothetical protein